MPSKGKKKQEAESKKSQQKKKDKLLEDKTFGLKNKNKSKKVQAFVQSTQKSIMHGGDPKQRKAEEDRKRQKALQKAAKKAKEDEQNALFGEALMAVKSKKSTDQKAGKVEAAGRDAGDDDKKKSGTSKAMKMMFQMDAKEMEDKLKEDPNYIPTIEDEIEMLRQKKLKELRDSGKKGTPVTEKSFKEWQERKRKRKAAEAKKLVDAELKKKKGGKGLSVLSGKDLFEYKRDLFKDDDLDNDATTIVKETENGNNKENGTKEEDVKIVAEKVQSDLFLGEDSDDDLDDIIDDE